MLLLIASVFVVSMAMPRNPMASPFQGIPVPIVFISIFSIAVQPDAVVPSMETAAFSTNGQFMNMDVDGVIPDYFNKKTEKMPMQKRVNFSVFHIFTYYLVIQRKDILFLSSMPEDSSFGFADVPEHFDINEQQPGVAPQMTGSVSQPQSDEFYNFGESQEAISNPAATYLEGGDFDKVNQLSYS